MDPASKPVGRAHFCLIAGAAFVCSFSMLSFNTNARKESIAIVCLILVCFTAMYNLSAGVGYSAHTDVRDKNSRGKYVILEEDTEESVVRNLYSYASYPSVRTDWPVRFMFAVFGSLSLGAVVRPTDGWMRITCYAMAVLLLVQAWSAAFNNIHGDSQAQIARDALFCKYNVLLELNATKFENAMAKHSLAPEDRTTALARREQLKGMWDATGPNEAQKEQMASNNSQIPWKRVRGVLRKLIGKNQGVAKVLIVDVENFRGLLHGMVNPTVLDEVDMYTVALRTWETLPPGNFGPPGKNLIVLVGKYRVPVKGLLHFTDCGTFRAPTSYLGHVLKVHICQKRVVKVPGSHDKSCVADPPNGIGRFETLLPQMVQAHQMFEVDDFFILFAAYVAADIISHRTENRVAIGGVNVISRDNKGFTCKKCADAQLKKNNLEFPPAVPSPFWSILVNHAVSDGEVVYMDNEDVSEIKEKVFLPIQQECLNSGSTAWAALEVGARDLNADAVKGIVADLKKVQDGTDWRSRVSEGSMRDFIDLKYHQYAERTATAHEGANPTRLPFPEGVSPNSETQAVSFFMGANHWGQPREKTMRALQNSTNPAVKAAAMEWREQPLALGPFPRITGPPASSLAGPPESTPEAPPDSVLPKSSSPTPPPSIAHPVSVGASTAPSYSSGLAAPLDAPPAGPPPVPPVVLRGKAKNKAKFSAVALYDLGFR